MKEDISTRLSSRLGTNASSSSKKMMQGAEALAREKTCRTALSLSPTYYPGIISTPIDNALMNESYFIEQLRTLDTDKICARLICYCLGQQSLSTTRWTPKQDSTWCLYSNSTEKLWPLYGLNDTHVKFFSCCM